MFELTFGTSYYNKDNKKRVYKTFNGAFRAIKNWERKQRNVGIHTWNNNRFHSLYNLQYNPVLYSGNTLPIRYSLHETVWIKRL